MVMKKCGTCYYFNHCYNNTLRSVKDEVLTINDEVCEEYKPSTGKQSEKKMVLDPLNKHYYTSFHNKKILALYSGNKIFITGIHRKKFSFEFLTGERAGRGTYVTSLTANVQVIKIVSTAAGKSQVQSMKKGDVFLCKHGKTYQVFLYDDMMQKNIRGFDPFTGAKWTICPSTISRVISKKDVSYSTLLKKV